MSRLADVARFQQRVSELIAEFSSPIYAESLDEKEQPTPLEHVTRRHFIDPFLVSLGWDMRQLNAEIIEEARARGETTLRLDYLGVNRETRNPLLIVEAKAWATPFLSPSMKEESIKGPRAAQAASLICAAIEHCKAGGTPEESPVSLEWAKFLSKLHEYVSTVYLQSGHVVARVAMTSGQWLVTFTDPLATFITPGPVNDLLVNVFRGDELVTKAEQIYSELAQRSISNVVPLMVLPSLLHAYISPADIRRAYRALWVSRHATGAHWKPRPSLDFEVAMVLERRDGVLITVIDQSLLGESLPHEYDALAVHIEAIEGASERLLNSVCSELKTELNPADVTLFPGFPISMASGFRSAAAPPSQPRVELLKLAPNAGEFLLVTGAEKHFLLEKPSVLSCNGHDWGSCQGKSQHFGTSPVLTRSVTPRAFFASGETHHCAHRVVHDRRSTRCQIDAFDEFLCCRACRLQSFCWQPSELAALPCGT